MMGASALAELLGHVADECDLVDASQIVDALGLDNDSGDLLAAAERARGSIDGLIRRVRLERALKQSRIRHLTRPPAEKWRQKHTAYQAEAEGDS